VPVKERAKIMMSLQKASRVENAAVRRIDRERSHEGTNGIGLPFILREKPDWKALLAFRYDAKGRRISR